MESQEAANIELALSRNFQKLDMPWDVENRPIYEVHGLCKGNPVTFYKLVKGWSFYNDLIFQKSLLLLEGKVKALFFNAHMTITVSQRVHTFENEQNQIITFHLLLRYRQLSQF